MPQVILRDKCKSQIMITQEWEWQGCHNKKMGNHAASRPATQIQLMIVARMPQEMSVLKGPELILEYTD
jgi:hypothetical protein